MLWNKKKLYICNLKHKHYEKIIFIIRITYWNIIIWTN